MDAKAMKKALFRSKLNAKKKDTRIDSPLVRYNESDQPVCRVCNVVLKSESYWDAHQASRKHHEAISVLKASAAGTQRVSNTRSESSIGTENADSGKRNFDTSEKASKPLASSGLPPNFFENPESVTKKAEVEPGHETATKSKQTASSETKHAKGSLPEGFFDKKMSDLSSSSAKTTSEAKQTTASEMKPVVKGALPAGFFDNKEADLLARGIKPVKPDIKDEYKEFEKLIQEDLQVVDNRMEEEEVDAAEMIEEEEQLEQRSYKERVEILKRKRMELKAARLAKRSKIPEASVKAAKAEESSSSSDDEEDENLTVDWRAQHL
ncbi:PREDICTED: zinc finger protein 830 isoform X2 [Tarenaya hassleriana]|uniref:zinc finger protein 830 isoform X2 n=1 Tax=Tarenaya hassleriana TaxID=28532 RepID=UPI0008FD8A78|nr:PREDICTED: zinc finger protein 830 isoform X2 [Tarenaya hassleriana]